LPRNAQLSRAKDQLDPAQRLFGTLGYLGQVRFTDAVMEGTTTITVPTPSLFRPRSDSISTYYDGTEPKGRKFYMHGELAKGNLPLEACPAGSRFAFSVDFDNLTQAEVGLLLYGLGLGEPRLVPKLGGAKPACLGTIEVVEPHLVVYDQSAAYRDFDDVPTDTTELMPYIAAAREEKLVLDAQLKEIERILRWPRTDGRECPDRNY
jgi:hypothetical protein